MQTCWSQRASAEFALQSGNYVLFLTDFYEMNFETSQEVTCVYTENPSGFRGIFFQRLSTGSWIPLETVGVYYYLIYCQKYCCPFLWAYFLNHKDGISVGFFPVQTIKHTEVRSKHPS